MNLTEDKQQIEQIITGLIERLILRSSQMPAGQTFRIHHRVKPLTLDTLTLAEHLRHPRFANHDSTWYVLAYRTPDTCDTYAERALLEEEYEVESFAGKKIFVELALETENDREDVGSMLNRVIHDDHRDLQAEDVLYVIEVNEASKLDNIKMTADRTFNVKLFEAKHVRKLLSVYV